MLDVEFNNNSSRNIFAVLISGKVFSAAITDKYAEAGRSNFEETIDVTGATTIDLLVENRYVGIFNLTSTEINGEASYSTSSGVLDPAETFTTDLGTTGEVILDDGAGTVTVQNLSQALVAGEVITGDNSGNTVTVDGFTQTAATEAIDTITNPPELFPFTLRPAAGVVLTITGTAYSGITAGQIALKATDYVLDGDKGEYIVLEIDPLGSGALIEKQVVNGLI